MGFKCGIVGLPNIGKSTLFNAITASKNAEAANFPFCTIDPNVGVVDVPDLRLEKISRLSKSEKKVFTNITFVDIAGLVKGASKGEGLGNKFLSHIREVDAIIHLVRCFKSEKIQHVNNEINPVADLETIHTEISLADIELIEKKLEKNKKKDLTSKEIDILEKALNHLSEGKTIEINSENNIFLNRNGILSTKPKIIVCNVDEESLISGNEFTTKIREKFSDHKIISICADIEDQLSSLDKSEKEIFMKEIGLEKTGLNKLIRAGYDLLELDTFFTSGPKESRAWTVKKNTIAPKAAGVIHSDFEKNFIRAEAVSCEDFIKFGSAEKCKEKGKLRIEGKDYIVKDGDVLYFRVNP
ncbi:MAG: redox-regulated ATPase YchF [Candidatus Pelagibacter sp.]|nr:redox-regulated ATPase YchF [Candidatus Pelagibacter sp.]OUW24548.1 MAG: redox-regulated ATPase YchF [Rickettsiales bacterium TMED174]|tara:strand:+ start:855 stop:1922 length:1068 start_codon:yes stop_codon:yes gene_type:complete